MYVLRQLWHRGGEGCRRNLCNSSPLAALMDDFLTPGRCTVGSQGSSRGPGEVGAAAFEEREEGEEPVAAAGGKDRVLCPSRRNPRVIGE